MTKPCIHRHYPWTHPKCFDKQGNPKKHWADGMRIGFLDIETSHLDADFGKILSWYIKPEGSKDYDSWVISPEEIDSGMYDYWGLIMFKEVLADYDILMTWYGDRFDIPYLRTRCVMNRLEFPVYRELYHIDLWKTSRSKFRFRSNRLANVTEKLNVEDRKTPVDPQVWIAILRGDDGAISYVAEHNRKDVIVLEDVYKLFRPFMTFPRTSI